MYLQTWVRLLLLFGPKSACEFCWFALVEFTGGPRTEAKRRPHVTFRLISAERTISVVVDQVVAKRSQLSNNFQRLSDCENRISFVFFSRRHKLHKEQDAARVVRHCPEAGGLAHQRTLASATARPTPPALAHHQPRRNVPIKLRHFNILKLVLFLFSPIKLHLYSLHANLFPLLFDK